MGIAVFPPSSGISLADGNTAGWNLGTDQWEQISEYKTTSGATSFDFTSIPQTYRKLVLVGMAMEVQTAGTAIFMRINSDSTASTYNVMQLRSGSGSDNASYLSQNAARLTWGDVAAGQACNYVIEFPNYTSTSSKYFNFLFGNVGTQYVSGFGNYRTGSTTNAITTISIIGQTSNGLFFSSNPGPAAVLYGVK